MAARGIRHPRAVLDDESVANIVWRYSQGGNTYMSLADEYGVDSGTISAILRGKTWKHVTGGVPTKAPARPLDTHCRQGHEFTEANTIWRHQPTRPRPTRRCRKCMNINHSKNAKRKRGNFR